VEDRTKVLLTSLVGAVAGGVLGYLYLTEGGALQRAGQAQIDDFVGELRKLKAHRRKARAAADELADAAGVGSREPHLDSVSSRPMSR
jgi:hypothetical protein